MDHISTMFNGVEEKPPHVTYTICGICGEAHEASDCDIVSLKATISDTPVLSKARQSLPANLQLVSMADGTHSIITSAAIPKGTRFGPYEAKEQFSISPAVLMPLKVFNSSDDTDDSYFKEYYLNTTNEYECNWMYFVSRATNLQEQNLICYQDGGLIYYISIKDIDPKEHLRVWYAPYYGKLMKMGSFMEVQEEPVVETQLNVSNLTALMKKQQNIRDRKMWICKFCGIHEENIPTFASHIAEHYVAKLKKVCPHCDAKFQTTKALEKHIYIQHNDLVQNPKLPLALSTQKSISNHETQLDPLLNEVPGDNVLLEHLNFQDTTMPNDTLQLNVDTILNEDENFNFEMKDIDKEPEKIVCDICLKEFTKLKQLILHLNAHTGKYACPTCMKVYVRKENLVAHKCLNNSSTTENKCSICHKLFTLNKYLQRHMKSAHGPSLRCAGECKKSFASQAALDAHNCSATSVAAASSEVFPCPLCAKEFGNQRYLNRHMKTHERNGNNSVVHICEVCSNQFTSMKALRQHLNTHKEPEFVCMLCEKSFQRRQNFLEHMELHKSDSPQACHICDAKFTQKKFLTQHLLLHTDEQKFPCSECPQVFRQKSNLTKHTTAAHVRECRQCGLKFATSDECRAHVKTTHAIEDRYECPVCKIKVKLRSSLKRHVKQKHKPEEYDATILDEYLSEIDKKYKGADAANSSACANLNATSNSSSSILVENADTSSEAKPPAPKRKKKAEPKKRKKIQVLSNVTVSAPQQQQIDNNTMLSDGASTSSLMGHGAHEVQVQLQVQNDAKVAVPVAAPGSQEEADMLHLLQANNDEVMQDMASGLQLDEIVNVLGGAAKQVDYGNMAMEFENNFVGKVGEIGMTHTFDGESVCLSMPELNEHGQPVSIGGENIQSSYILENASLNGPVEQVVLYILGDQKPS